MENSIPRKWLQVARRRHTGLKSPGDI